MAPLREEKYAQTKIDILKAFLAELKTKSLGDISVKEVCAKVRISEGTFFNYFANKAEVITYYAQIWSIRVRYGLGRMPREETRGLAGIYAIFAMQAEELAANPAAMREITAERALSRAPHAFREMTGEEYRLLFPGMEGVEDIEGADVVSLMIECLEAAIDGGELSKSADIKGLLVDLLTAFFATHVTLWQMDMDVRDINSHYKRQLDAIFRMCK
jgi:AcrR family transcriptional regulator